MQAHDAMDSTWIDLDRLGQHRIGSSNYFNISVQAELEIQIVFRVAVVVVVVALTNTLANHASEDNATPQWPLLPAPLLCTALRPWTVLPRRALGPPLSASTRIARQRVVCGKVRACCLIYAAVRGLFALLLLNNFFDTFLPYTDEQVSGRRDVVCSVCV